MRHKRSCCTRFERRLALSPSSPSSLVLLGFLCLSSLLLTNGFFIPPLPRTQISLTKQLPRIQPPHSTLFSSTSEETSTTSSEETSTTSSEETSRTAVVKEKKELFNSTSDETPLITTTTTTTTSTTPSKLRQLKDRMWVRETLEDLTSAEFASSLIPTSTEETKKRNVDFEALLSKLNSRISEMCVLVDENSSDAQCRQLDPNGVLVESKRCYGLQDGRGMGSMVYTEEQRMALLGRIIATRQRLLKAMEGREIGVEDDGELNLDSIRSQLQDSILLEKEMVLEDETATTKSNATGSNATEYAKLYVREDGSIDWEGALQDRAALKLFGTAVWARINGLNPEHVSEEEEEEVKGVEPTQEENKVTAKIIETEALREMREKVDALKGEYEVMSAQHTALLNSAISPGSTIANINLASLSPKLRTEIRTSESALNTKKEQLTFLQLNYELERLFTYFEGEMGNTYTKGYIPLQDRLAVAEFGLLESQVDVINEQIAQGESVDSDVLAVVVEQLTDFKRRLGIDYYVTGVTYDREAIQRWLNDLLLKTKEGLGFYVKGCKLLWNDLVFCVRLVSKAIGGYTLKPREVNTLRRTFRDFLTFIPFVIILIIPLSPVGHVLVFGAIQRFFPDFFPSCFTERRQNLLQLYESTEYSEITINETWKEKLVRISEAIVFLTVNFFRTLIQKLRGLTQESGGTIGAIGPAKDEKKSDSK